MLFCLNWYEEISQQANNPDRHEAIKREIATRGVAKEPFDDLLALLGVPAPVMTPKPGKAKKARKSRRAGQVIARGPDKLLTRVFLGRDSGKKRHYHDQPFMGRRRRLKIISGSC